MNNRSVSVSADIKATPKQIFDILCDPKKHSLIDGNEQVQRSVQAPKRLELGSKFSMDMKIGAKYKVTNKVIFFEENKAIAWSHFARHVWRYDIEDNGDGTSKVTETWDWSPMLLPLRIGVEVMQFPGKNKKGMRITLKKLAALVE